MLFNGKRKKGNKIAWNRGLTKEKDELFMSECTLCNLMADACKLIVKDGEGRKTCEELGKKLSNNTITVDEFFMQLEEKLGITDLEMADKAVEISKKEEKI